MGDLRTYGWGKGGVRAVHPIGWVVDSETDYRVFGWGAWELWIFWGMGLGDYQWEYSVVVF